MQETGQFEEQAPQSIHADSSIFLLLSSTSEIQETGQTGSHAPQPIQLSLSILYDIFPPFILYLRPNFTKSFSTSDIPASPNVFTSTFKTLGERNAGRVGPIWIFFTPRDNNARSTITAFCSYHAIL